MALTQSEGGPSWDEEVVPALRKRLESESRTLSRRISWLEDDSSSPSTTNPTTPRTRQPAQPERVRPTRTRTYSQPYNIITNNGKSGSSSQPKPTRIPQRSKTPTSSATPKAQPQSYLNTYGNGSENGHSSGILHEQPPFSSTSTSFQHEESPRASEDSEEHPFEHWYRGEVARNGGVGELRVGKRKEMLDIANYGHPTNNRPMNAITEAINRRRRRADSMGGIQERESFYMDERRAEEIERVLDEMPLTDFEGETDDPGVGSDYYEDSYFSHSTPKQQPPPMPHQSGAFAPDRITTPTRGMSEPPGSSPASRHATPQQQRSVSNPSSSKRAVSPETPSSAAKKSRTAASKATRARLEAARKEEEESNRRSVAYYPTPSDEDGSGLEGAIPKWTQPVVIDGNWDNVVIPVVARKQGLNGYATTDGSQASKPKAGQIAPAPGTFGYDFTKYRPPREDGEVLLDEFGRQPEMAPHTEEPQPATPLSTTVHTETRTGQRPISPQPFSHYAPTTASNGDKLQPISMDATKLEVGLQQQPDDEEDSGGCCKCVLM